MPASRLGLYDLIGPQFALAFPEYVNRYLSVLGVDVLRTSVDDNAIVYSGVTSFTGSAGAAPERVHRDPSGAVLQWEDFAWEFRLTIPREGTADLQTAAHAITGELHDLAAAFETSGSAMGSDYPGIRFRLELLVSSLTFHLGSEWLPGKVGPGFRIIPVARTDPEFITDDVRIVLPKAVLVYEQGHDLSHAPKFSLQSWGGGGFDAAHDAREGEVIRMEPPLALHTSRRVAFAIGQIIVDFSEDSTPPEILEKFGADESFQGFLVKSGRFYWLDESKRFGFSISFEDLLISLAGQVSFEARVDVFLDNALTLDGFEARLKMYDTISPGRPIPYSIDDPVPSPNQIRRANGSAAIEATGVIQVEITGGNPTYTVQMELGPSGGPRTPLTIEDGTQARLASAGDPLRPAGPYDLHVTVEDSSTPPKSYVLDLILNLLTPRGAASGELPGTASDRAPSENEGARQPATLTIDERTDVPAAVTIRSEAAGDTEDERVYLDLAGRTATVTVGPSATTATPPVFSVTVPHGQSRTITVNFPAQPAAPNADVYFSNDRPHTDAEVAAYVSDFTSSATAPDDVYLHATNGGLAGSQGLRDWATANGVTATDANAFASFESSTRAGADQLLSDRRFNIVNQVLSSAAVAVAGAGHGQTQAHGTGSQLDRVVHLHATASGAGTGTLRATLVRPVRPTVPPTGGVPPPTPTAAPSNLPTAPPAPHPPDSRPPALKRLSARVRLERNIPTLIELSGEIDFETEAERTAERGRQSTASSASTPSSQTANTLSANREDPSDNGRVEFELRGTWDPASNLLTETIALHGRSDNSAGLRSWRWTDDASFGKDFLGALLIFAPIINAAAANVHPDDAVTWVELGVALAVPATLAGIGVLRTKRITLYGGEAHSSQLVRSQADGGTAMADFGLLFDYGVEFRLRYDPLELDSGDQPLKVRWRSIGFQIVFGDPFTYHPVFDTSKGFDLDLVRPGMFHIGGALGRILQVTGARIARFNPTTLEIDLALRVDLGVISVDQLRIKIPFEGGLPQVIPTGVHVNIPSTLVGSGYLNIIDETVNGVATKGFAGSVDITVVPIKLRVAGSLAIVSLSQTTPEPRSAIGVYASLLVELPSPIILGSSGLGLYGFSGLFAMHYRRTEDPRLPGDSVAPALRWLQKAGGEPYLLERGGVMLWEPAFDRWSFGVGLLLGTLEGAFLANFNGMFVLELPGPRILIFVKVRIIQNKPDPKSDTVTVGILGVIDLDFENDTITIGVLVDLAVSNPKAAELFSVQIPIEIFFNLRDGREWHVDIGTIDSPARALILNLVRARGYFMLHGDHIDHFPSPSGAITLPGIAVACGIEASLLFGSESAGLYLRLSARADVGISFSPFYLAGVISVEGELRIFIVSVEAGASLDLIAPDPVTIHGEAHACVSFFFFDLCGHVEITINPATHTLPPPELVRSVYLQSHAPALVAGQGGDRPIDGSLGNAAVNAGDPVPSVPIDSVPVIQFQAAPLISPAFSTFTALPGIAQGLTLDGWLDIGAGRRVRYTLKRITLTVNNAPVTWTTPLPPATWRRPQPTTSSSGTIADTAVDLALFSSAPVTATFALERSTDLDKQVDQNWGRLCTPVAPPVCVLWTFCRQPIGPSTNGWTLTGIPAPDPPGTRRGSPPPTRLVIEQPPADPAAELIATLAAAPYLLPARIDGVVSVPPSQTKSCVDFKRPDFKGSNPLIEQELTFIVQQPIGKSLDSTSVTGQGDTRGLFCGNLTVIELPVPASAVDVTLFGNDARVEAMTSQAKVVASAAMMTPAAKQHIETLRIEAPRISRLAIFSSGGKTLLLEVCQRPADVAADPCERALRMPGRGLRPGKSQLPAEITPRVKLPERWLTFETGAARRVRLFIAINGKDLAAMIVRQLEDGGSIVSEKSLDAFVLTTVSGLTTGLPQEWTDAPWAAEVLPVAHFLGSSRFAELTRLVVEIKPDPKVTKIQLVAAKDAGDIPTMIGVIEVCSEQERRRATQDQELSDGATGAAGGFLAQPNPVALLAPNTDYTLKIEYDVQTESGTVAAPPQSYRFRTDAAPPARLDPWVMGTTPDNDLAFHFYRDPVRVVFNDSTIVPLFAAYGSTLNLTARAADGSYVTPTGGTTEPAGSPPAVLVITPAALTPVASSFVSPFYDALAELAATLPCIPPSTPPPHASYTAPLQLAPRMAYTLDIEASPAAPEAAGRHTPLFRRSFQTSRYPSLEALAEEVRQSVVRHLALPSRIAEPAGSDPVIALTDAEIETLLAAAGAPPLPAATRSALILLWAQRTPGGPYMPHAIVADASEPLWRTRSEPRLTVVDAQNDPSFERVVPQQVPSLEIVGDTNVRRFVRSTAGTRSIAFISDTLALGPADALTLSLHRPASALYGLDDRSAVLVSLAFDATAPWEAADE